MLRALAIAVAAAPLVLLLAGAAIPGERSEREAAASREGIRVLVFSKTAGFRHASITDGVAALRSLAADPENQLSVTHSEDASVMTDERLAAFDVVLFLSTTGDILDGEQQAAFERFIRGGGGFVGVHAATDTEYDWPWYGRLVGAYFASHPAVQQADVLIEDREHPSTVGLPERWPRRDEWYNFRTNPRDDESIEARILATLDETTYSGGTMGDDHPIMWCHEFDGGRSWYHAGGHTRESFTEPLFMRAILGGIRWAAGHD